MFGNLLEEVRSSAPTIHCITNFVTIHDVANALLACGAKPVMANAPQEAAEITAGCQGLVLNLGMLREQTSQAMLLAAEEANRLGHPVILDPVGVGASTFRKEMASQLLKTRDIAVIRGNRSEILALAGEGYDMSGVEAGGLDLRKESSLSEGVSFVKRVSAQTGSIVVMTGHTDLVSDGSVCYAIKNGREEMRLVTGTGCQLSGLLGAFVAANQKQPLEAAAAAVCAMGLAGEIAMKQMKPEDGNATYGIRIIDALFHMRGPLLKEGAKYEVF